MNDAVLVLEDGTTFEGLGVGADGVAVGEIVFNTSMTGYQEIVTDPSYSGQIVVMTTPHIGNYGVAAADAQHAAPMCAGLVVRSMSRIESNWRSEGGFAAYLRANDVVVLTEVDTRRLTRHIRDRGAMNASMGSGEVDAHLTAARDHPRMDGTDLASKASTSKGFVVPAEGERIASIVACDLGIKRDILMQLAHRGIETEVVPAATPAADILARRPDGVFLSNGPGDPEPVLATTESVRQLLGQVPIFGICLGHQILGLAMGARTFKLPFGHHGGNHPVQRLDDGRVEITAQNHGFAVDLWSLTSSETDPDGRAGTLPDRVTGDFGTIVPTHQNLNDGTLEGMECPDVAAFSVQYHPEAAPGPNDATGLFDRFAGVIGGGGHATS